MSSIIEKRDALKKYFEVHKLSPDRIDFSIFFSDHNLINDQLTELIYKEVITKDSSELKTYFYTDFFLLVLAYQDELHKITDNSQPTPSLNFIDRINNNVLNFIKKGYFTFLAFHLDDKEGYKYIPKNISNNYFKLL